MLNVNISFSRYMTLHSNTILYKLKPNVNRKTRQNFSLYFFKRPSRGTLLCLLYIL